MIDQPNLFDQPGPELDDALAVVMNAVGKTVSVVSGSGSQETVAQTILDDLRDAGFHLSINGISRDVDADVVEIGHRHPATAQAMADKVLPKSGSFRRSLVEWLAWCADRPNLLGATDYEIEAHYEKSHQAASGARSTLKSDGWVMAVVVDGNVVTRTNEFGNEATVWTLTPAARAALFS